MLPIHPSIREKLNSFCDHKKIPNIIFYGPSGCGKRTVANNFISNIYDGNKCNIQNFVMYVNCSYGKGIKFIRDELKFFAKTNIHSNGGTIFKTILLFNADKLTIDAQSALRRCIELFSHTTRFFIVIEDQNKLMKPILSRFCSIYIPNPIFKGESVNLHRYNINNYFSLKTLHSSHNTKLIKQLNTFHANSNSGIKRNMDFSVKLYELGYSSLDIIDVLQNNLTNKSKSICSLSEENIVEVIFIFHKIKKEIRQEKILMFFVLNFMFLGLDDRLKNISFM